MAERRFSEAEVAEIFERAAKAQPKESTTAAHPGGMTLSQLVAIGREVGISAEAMSGAARAVSQVGQVQVRRFLGLPLGVGRTVELGRTLSTQEWERLVVDLRETFDARGSVKSEGSLRQWTNGNLQVLLEPTATGQRLRLKTIRGQSLSLMMMGIGMVALAAITLAIDRTGRDLSMALGFTTIGVGAFAAGALRLPGWARLRGRQMEEIANRLVAGDGSGAT